MNRTAPYQIEMEHPIPHAENLPLIDKCWHAIPPSIVNANAADIVTDNYTPDAAQKLDLKYKGFWANALHDLSTFGEEVSKGVVRGVIDIVGGYGTLAVEAGTMIKDGSARRYSKKLAELTPWGMLASFGESLSFKAWGGEDENSALYKKQQQLGDLFVKVGKAVEKFADYAVNTPELKPSEEIFAGSIFENPSATRIATTLMGAVPSLLVLSGMNKIAGPVAAYTVFGMGDNSDILKETRDRKDISDEKRRGLFAVATAGTMLMDLYTKPLELIFGKQHAWLKGLSGKMSRAGMAALTEGVNEVGQQGIQNLVKRFGYDNTYSLLTGLFESFIAGAVAGGSGRLGTDMQYQKIADKINANMKPDENGVMPKPATVKDVEDAMNAILPGIDKDGKVSEAFYQGILEQLSKFDQMVEKLGDSPEGQRLKQWKREINSIGEQLMKAYEPYLNGQGMEADDIAGVRVTYPGDETQGAENLPQESETVSEAPIQGQEEITAQQAEELRQEAQQEVKGTAIVDVPLDKISLSPDIPNFKEGSNEYGVVAGEQLQGTYDRMGTPPVVLWRRKNGKLEIITGRHRLDLARRTGEKDIPAQIVNEADGFDAEKARMFDIEQNIRDEKGTVRDYARYFKAKNMTAEEAKAKGLLSREKGRTAYAIAMHGTKGLYDAFINGVIKEAQAAAIAEGAPLNEAAQAAGIKAAAKMDAAGLRALVSLLAQSKPSAEATPDLFGFDDSAVKEAEAIAREVAKDQKEIAAKIRAVKGALKNPELAREMGLNFRITPENIGKEVERLLAEAEALANFATNPTLMKKYRDRIQAKETAQLQANTTADNRRVTAEQLRQEIKAVQAWALFMSADTGLFSSPMEWFKSRFALPGEYESMGIAPAMEAAAMQNTGKKDVIQVMLDKYAEAKEKHRANMEYDQSIRKGEEEYRRELEEWEKRNDAFLKRREEKIDALAAKAENNPDAVYIKEKDKESITLADLLAGKIKGAKNAKGKIKEDARGVINSLWQNAELSEYLDEGKPVEPSKYKGERKSAYSRVENPMNEVLSEGYLGKKYGAPQLSDMEVDNATGELKTPSFREEYINPEPALKEMQNILKADGWQRYHQSGKRVASSSAYMEKDGQTIRLSDHQLPETAERVYNTENGLRKGWTFEFVPDTRDLLELYYAKDKAEFKDTFYRLAGLDEDITQYQLVGEKAQTADSIRTALKEIADGKDEAVVKGLRNDLQQYGSTGDVSFIWGDKKKGIVHIVHRHGVDTLKHVFDVVANGPIVRYKDANRTVVLGKDGYEAVLSLDEHGKNKTWLLTGWDTSIDERSEFSPTSTPTQITPAFCRRDLGAMLQDIIISDKSGEVNAAQSAGGVKAQFQTIDNQNDVTINIDGIDRPTTNADGKRIADTAEGVRNFWAWFGNSKAVDEQGRPLVFYHGSSAKFDVFDISKGRATMDIQGAFFAADKMDAAGYGDEVRAFYLRMENPASFNESMKALRKHQSENEAGIKAREDLIAEGYDSVNNDDEFIVFNSNQIKSATDNNGEFSKTNPNIYFQQTSYKGDIAERARGAMMTLPDGRQTIALFKSANASTFIHEAGHLFLSDLEKYAGQNAKVAALLLRTRGWQDGEFNRLYNVKLRDDGRYIVTDKRSHTVYDNMESGFATAGDAAEYAKSELFARGFEKYCARGQAPTSFLDKTFAMFKKWLARMKSIVADEVKLNDDILSVYDRIFTAGSETGEDLEFYTAESDENVRKQFEELKEARRKNREAALLMAVDTANEPVPASEAFKPMRDITKSRQGLGEWWTKYIVPIDTRAMDVSEGLWARLQRYEFNLGVKMNRAVAQAEPFLKLWQKMTPEDTLTLDLILKNQAVNEEQPNEEMTKRRNAILDKYEGGREAYDAVVALLEKLRADGMAAGMDIGKLTDYFPRKVKYYNELMAELMNDPAMAEPINRAIAEAKRANANITDDELAEVIDKFIRSGAFRGKSSRINPGATKARTVEGIDNVLNQYYEPSDQALLKHIASMIEATENRKIWGYDRQTAAQEAEATQAEDKSFGAIIAAEMAKDGVIDATETKEAAAILNARLGEHGVSNPALKFLRDLAYVYTMGGVNTALRQLDDTAMAIYKAGLWPTLKTVFGKKEVTKKDLGIDSIAEEFAEATRMSKFLEKLFTWNGINLIDAFGKNLLTNSVLTKYRDMARNNPNELAKRIKYLEDETVSTVADFAEGKLTDNVKFVLFNELADVQPVTKSQMPEGYLTGGNMRVVYSLKTFLIRRMNTVARDAGKLIKQGIMTKDFGTFAKGFANFTRLAALCIMAGGGADWLIDLLYGRKFDIQDSILDNILGLFMLNRYTLYNARDRGPEAMIASSVIPPILSVPWDFGSDVYNTLFTDKKLKDAQSLKGVPIIGRFYYWWFGKGVEIKEKQEKRRRREARKKAE